MAGLAAIDRVGESIAQLLRDRRSLLAAEGRLATLPPALDIEQASAGRLAGDTAITAGLTVTPWRATPAKHPGPRGPARPEWIALDLSYLVASWAGTPGDECALIGWAMLELTRYPVLDRSLLLGAGVWARDEVVQIALEDRSDTDLFAIWAAFGRHYRASFTFTARVVRIGYDQVPDALPVVATRFALTDADPLTAAMAAPA